MAIANIDRRHRSSLHRAALRAYTDFVSPVPSPFHGIFSSLNDTPPLGSRQPQWHDDAAQASSSGSRGQGLGQVAVDIYEQDGYYIIKAPIAGVRLSELDIEVADNVVTIRGVRRQHDDIPEDGYYLKECFWGEFERSVTLPVNVDPRRIRATFNKDSVLKILIPKEERVKIVRIQEG